MHLSRKLAIVTHVVPPAPFGSAVRLWRLFRDTPADDYCILTCRDLPEATDGRLSCRHHRLPSEWRQIRKCGRLFRSQVEAFNRLFKVLQRARNIVRIARAESAGMIMGLSGDLFDLPSACLAARWCRLPFIAALDDDYVYQWPDGVQRGFAARQMRWVIRSARQVVVLNDIHADDLARRYGVRASVVPNPCETPVAPTVSQWPRTAEEIHIVFTGTVYYTNIDVIRVMTAALDLPGMELARLDIHGHVVPSELFVDEQPRQRLHGARSLTGSTDAQSEADILLLPLGFGEHVRDIARTASPFKMGEYLSSGRPVVACVPQESFVAQYFRRNGCGVVVDTPASEALAVAVRRITNDAGFRSSLVEKAKACADRDFGLATVRKQFKTVLEAAA